LISEVRRNVRRLAGGRADEVYVTLVPECAAAPSAQAGELYRAVCETLRATGARVFAERIFGTGEAIAAAEAARRTVLGELNDHVPPTKIVVAPGQAGPLAGIQLHAVASASAMTTFRDRAVDATACGRELRIGDERWLTLGGVSSGGHGLPAEQARRMFECTGRLLRQAGTDLRSVARTWLWLHDICDWYADFNAERTTFFRREGLIGPNHGGPRLPASTGIGLANAAGTACALDLIALPGREEQIELLAAGGDQDSAFAYGSAFSRAAIVPMPAGRTLMISGTAAIDAQGRSEHVGRIDMQIESTLGHVRSLLARAGCTDEHVLSALVYCKTPEVERAFLGGWADLGWPLVSMIADICRPELLFEVELVAGPVPPKGREV
jgi:enamine deaminase RidA (YjgF/YER057c/UK114 family)